ncbi:MAG: hypothetical protein C4318_03275 [Acidimicrobiia bacterium]
MRGGVVSWHEQHSSSPSSGERSYPTPSQAPPYDLGPTAHGESTTRAWGHYPGWSAQWPQGYQPNSWKVPPAPGAGYVPGARTAIVLIVAISLLTIAAIAVTGSVLSQSYGTGLVDNPSTVVSTNTLEHAVVKVSGEACNFQKFGTGFFASSGLIVTNAHVVAGVHTPHISYGFGGRQVTINTTVVHFDPDNDLAVLRTGVAGSPLFFTNSDPRPGEPLYAPGFPGGGEFRIKRATFIGTANFTTESIYGKPLSARRFFLMDSTLEPGNSGSPVVDQTGYVIGVATAISQERRNVGVAIPYERVAAAISVAQSSQGPVSSGSCYIKEG